MVFFTTPELLEIGDIPFACAASEAHAAGCAEYYDGLPSTMNYRPPVSWVKP